jgi:AcrR family transcriptional regulator
MATSGGGANSRLSVDDWVQEGFRVLAEDGVKALTLGRLCSRLGVTKGSFYWHFTDMKAYREAPIGTWAAVRDEHGAFDYDVSRELAGALEIGAKVSPFAMI